MSSTTNDLSLEMATSNFQNNITALWEKEKEYRKLLDESKLSTRELLLQEQGFVVVDHVFNHDIYDDNEFDTAHIFLTDFMRLGRYDIINIFKKLHDPSQDHKTIFAMINEHYDKTQDSDYGYLLSYCYGKGLGTEVDLKKMLELDQSLAERGYPLTLVEMASYYRLGKFFTKDIKKAQEYYQAATRPEQQDFYFSHFLYGFYLLKGEIDGDKIEQNINEGLRLLAIAAEHKQIFASMALATYYIKADDTCTNKYEKFYYYSKQLADLNHPSGSWFLARCYEKGYGVAKDQQQYLALLSKSAILGNKNAILELDNFYCFDFPIGVPVGDKQYVIPFLRYCFEGLRYNHAASTHTEEDSDSDVEQENDKKKNPENNEGEEESDDEDLVDQFLGVLKSTNIDKFAAIKSVVSENYNVDILLVAYELCCKCLQGHLLDHPTDSLIMGKFYQEGFLVPRDIKIAAACFKKAADLGSKKIAEEASNALMLLLNSDEETSLPPALIFSYYEKSSKNPENKAIYDKSANHLENFMPFFNTINDTWKSLGVEMPKDVNEIIEEYVYSGPEKPIPVKPIPDVNQTETNPQPRASWCKQNCSIM